MSIVIRWGWLVASLMYLAGAPSGADPIVHVDIALGGPHATVGVGDSVVVRVLASGIPPGGDGLGLFGFGFSICYDGAGLATADPVLGPLWTGTGFEQSRNDPGDVGLSANRFFEPAGPSGDDILLGTIEFTALSPGLFGLELTHFVGVGDNLLFDGTVLDADPESFFSPGSIQVNAVTPVPSLSPAFRVLLVGLLAAATRLSREFTPRHDPL